MRRFLILTFLVLSDLVFGQTTLSTLKRNPDIYVFNNSKDTIYLIKIDLGEFTITESFIIVDTVQIDGLGSSEIVFARTVNGTTKEHGAMFDISESKTISLYEIWNLDTKTLVFEAINSYNYNYNHWDARVAIPDSLQGLFDVGKGNFSYTYDFSIDSKGQVIIKNFRNINNCIADKQEGLYKFINGKYTIE